MVGDRGGRRGDRLEIIDALQAVIDRLDAALTETAKADRRVKALTALPGLGRLPALIILAEIGDIHRFPSARKLASRAGPTPTVRGSDRTLRYGHSHARATRVTVAVRLAEDAARLEVTDDGRGFARDATVTGFGLLGMRERVHLVAGSVDIDSGPDSGTRLTVTVPRGKTGE